jgi:hypothetical protein
VNNPAGILIPSSALALAAHNQGVSDGYARTMAGLIAVGGLFALAAVTALLVAWVKALFGTRQLADPRWFKALLWGGIAGILTMPLFGIGALVLGKRDDRLPGRRPGRTGGRSPAGGPGEGHDHDVEWLGSRRDIRGLVARHDGCQLVKYRWPPARHLVAVAGYLVDGHHRSSHGVIVVWAAWWAALFNARTLADRKWSTGCCGAGSRRL